MIVKGKVVKQTFHTTNTPVALKEWTCSLCGEPVEKGKRYVRYTWRKQYEIDDLPFHAECWSIVQAYCKAMDDNIFAIEDINAWTQTLPHCIKCRTKTCHKSRCKRMQKYVKHKPIPAPYDVL